jgi:DNA-binding MarR family transcriptional regulator
MTDWIGAAEVALSTFFVIVAVVLLARYRQASEGVNASSELNHELWRALEARLKKQDERIVELMGKVEVLQVRAALEKPLMQQHASQTSQISQQSQPAQSTQPPKPAPELRIQQQILEMMDPTEKAALRFLERGAKSTREITQMLDRSREHTARLMKGMYDKGLVERDESAKPFVYKLTDKGRSLVQAS